MTGWMLADARPKFLLEAVVLTLVGGTIGIFTGAGVSAKVRTLGPSIPATLAYLRVTIGLAISAGVGLFFGGPLLMQHHAIFTELKYGPIRINTI